MNPLGTDQPPDIARESSTVPYGFMRRLRVLIVVRRSWPSSVTAVGYTASALRYPDANRAKKKKGHLLEQQLGSVRYRELCHLLGTFAIRAPSIVSHQAALFTGIHLEFVG